MPYRKLLKNIIDKSGLTYKEVSEKCSSLDRPVDPSYISKIVNGKVSPPSDEISRVLAEACGANKNILVLEALLDKAPKELTDFIKNIYFALNADSFLYHLQEATFKKEEYNFKEEVDKFMHDLKSKPLSSFILEYNSEDILNKALAIAKFNAEYYNDFDLDDLAEEVKKNPNDDIHNIIEHIKRKSLLDYLPCVKDEALTPMFPKGTKFSISNTNYSEGDLVAYFDKKTGETLVRKFFKEDDFIIFSPINPNYKPLVYTTDQVDIIGKVSTAIINL